MSKSKRFVADAKVADLGEGLTGRVRTLSLLEMEDLYTKPGFKNRPYSQVTVDRYATEMRKGAWRLNGEPIIIGENGELLDGQHRIAAALEVGMPLTVLVVEGVPMDAFKSMGQGRVRTVDQFLTLAGETDSKLLLAILRLVASWEQGWANAAHGYQYLSPQDATYLLDRHPGIRLSIQAANKHKLTSPFRGVAGITTWAFIHYIGSLTHTASKADEFLEGLMVGEELRRGDPRLTLRNRLLAMRGDAPRGRVPTVTRMTSLTFGIKAWNAWVLGREMLVLKNDAGGIPEFEGQRALFRRMQRTAIGDRLDASKAERAEVLANGKT